jgi:hypothetical protein
MKNMVKKIAEVFLAKTRKGRSLTPSLEVED